MAKGSIIRSVTNIYSEKYGIQGIIKDYGMVTKLSFTYEDKEVEMEIARDVLDDESFEEAGLNVMESYIKNLRFRSKGLKLQLHYWYVDSRSYEGAQYIYGHGICTGHKKIMDSVYTHTSAVQAIYIDENEETAILITRSSVYNCPLRYCNYEEQDKSPEFIPDYQKIRDQYADSAPRPSIEPGKVLLVLADFCQYYFHSLYFVPKGSPEMKPLEYHGRAHIGTFQDSYRIHTKKPRVDIRYFPHFQNIDIYQQNIAGRPFYIENIGDVVLYVNTTCGTFRLEPGERKHVIKKNALKEKPILPGGVLYQAMILDDDM